MTEEKIEYCFFNGEILPVREAAVSVYDIGMLRGFGVYEGIKTYNKKAFYLKEHLDRLRRSASKMSLKIPYTDREVEKAIGDLLLKNNLSEAAVRIILTGGVAINGIEYDSEKPTFYILAGETSKLEKSLYEKGAKVLTFDHQRSYPESKTINYITAVLQQERRRREDAIEILFVHGGKILEASTSNFFLVLEDKIVTAKENVLLGITRGVVIELIKKEYRVEERDVLISELEDAKEAFVTGSYKEIVPVIQVDEVKIGDGTVGPVTKKIMKLFNERTKSYGL